MMSNGQHVVITSEAGIINGNLIQIQEYLVIFYFFSDLKCIRQFLKKNIGKIMVMAITFPLKQK